MKQISTRQRKSSTCTRVFRAKFSSCWFGQFDSLSHRFSSKLVWYFMSETKLIMKRFRIERTGKRERESVWTSFEIQVQYNQKSPIPVTYRCFTFWIHSKLSKSTPSSESTIWTFFSLSLSLFSKAEKKTFHLAIDSSVHPFRLRKCELYRMKNRGKKSSMSVREKQRSYLEKFKTFTVELQWMRCIER